MSDRNIGTVYSSGDACGWSYCDGARCKSIVGYTAADRLLLTSLPGSTTRPQWRHRWRQHHSPLWRHPPRTDPSLQKYTQQQHCRAAVNGRTDWKWAKKQM